MLTQPGWRSHTSQDLALAVFALTALVGGVASGAILWITSRGFTAIPTDVARGMIAGAVFLAFLRDLGTIRIPLPENRRLIPQEVFRHRPLRSAAQFGFELGTGVRTYVPASAPYILALGILLLVPSVLEVALAAGAFGAGRAWTGIARRLARERTRWDAVLVARTPALQTASSVLMGFAMVKIAW